MFGTNSGTEELWAVIELTEGGYFAIGGSTTSFHPQESMTLLKLRPDRSIEWSYILGT